MIGKRRRVLFSILLLGILACTLGRVDSGEEVESREVKFLLRPESFPDLMADLEKFWDLVVATAERQGLKVKNNRPFPGKKDTRYVSFFDTPGFLLYRGGYTLRKRCDDEEDLKSRIARRKCEMTLKYRSPDLLSGMVHLITPARDFKGETKVEEDFVVGKSAIRRLFSISGTVGFEADIGGKMKDYRRIFPGLKKLDIGKNEPVTRVRKITVRELTFKPGAIGLENGTTAEVTFSVWWLSGELKPGIVEFSFKHGYGSGGKPGGNIPKQQNLWNGLTRELQKACRDWILDGGTKTGLIFGIRSADQE